MKKKVVIILPYLFGVIFITIIFFFRRFTYSEYKFVYLFYSINFLYLFVKIVLSFSYKPCYHPVQKFKVSVIVPSYNESVESVVNSIRSILKQTYEIHEIIFVDDGSSSDEAFKAVKNIDINKLKNINPLNRATSLISIRLKQNLGKKEAQAIAFQRATGELFLLLDSDGEITTNSLAEMVRPFYSDKVGSVVGRIEVRNVNASYWTKVQDIFYSNSFQLGRSAQSQTGSVIVCSGALSLHRARFIRRNLDVFKKEKFFGVPCSAGDDRLLTDISLERCYKTVFQYTAVCYTDVPVTFRQLFKQQCRWAKSAHIISLYSIRYAFIRPIAIMWSMTETYLWLYNLVGMFVMLCIGGLKITIDIAIIASIYFILVSYLTNIYYSKKNIFTYIFSIYYSLGYSVVLFFVRIYSLLTIFRTGWSTR